jgi:hypothetical protein
MRVTLRFLAISLGLAIAVTGCASPPTAEVEAAKAAVDKATTARADQYAAESLKAAQDARAALDAELKAQEGKSFKSYDKTKELAIAAKAAGDKASADAIAGKEKADAAAAKEKADAAAREKAPDGGSSPRGSDHAAQKDQERPAGVSGRCAVGACHGSRHD